MSGPPPPPLPLSPYSLSSSFFSSDSSFFSSASSSSPAPSPAPAVPQPWWCPASPCPAGQQQPPHPPTLWQLFDLFAPVSRSCLGGGSFECAGAGCGGGNDNDLHTSGLACRVTRSTLDDDDRMEQNLAEEDAYRRRLELGKISMGGSYESWKWCQSQSQRPNRKQRIFCDCGYVCGNGNGLIHRVGEGYSSHFPWQNIRLRDLHEPKPTTTLLRKDNPNPNPDPNPNPSPSLFHHQICALKKNHISGWQSQRCPAPAPTPTPNQPHTDSINNHNHPAHNQLRTDSNHNHNHPAHNQPRTDSNHNHNQQFRGACRCCHCDGSSTGMYAVFLKESSSGRDSVGTGVFLPRPHNNTTKRKKTSLSTVLLPSKVVQALNLRLEDTQSHLVSPQHRATESSSDSHGKPLSCSPLQQITADISLPMEWTY